MSADEVWKGKKEYPYLIGYRNLGLRGRCIVKGFSPWSRTRYQGIEDALAMLETKGRIAVTMLSLQSRTDE